MNVAVANEQQLVVWEAPTWVQLTPPFCDAYRPQVPLASALKLAWWIDTVPAPAVRSNFIVSRPPLRMRADLVAVLTSVDRFPINASSKV